MQELFHLNKISVAIQSSEKYILNFRVGVSCGEEIRVVFR